MATVTLPTLPKRPQLWLLAFTVLVFALFFGFLFLRLDGDEPTAQETYRSLASSSFTEELPLGIILDRRSTHRWSGGEELGKVAFFDVRKSRGGGGGGGGIVVVSYQIYRSPQAAMRAYENVWRDRRNASVVRTRGYRFFKAEISRPHACMNEVQEFCQAVVGNVILEALSRIHMFKPGEQSHVGAILDAALDHLDRTVESE